MSNPFARTLGTSPSQDCRDQAHRLYYVQIAGGSQPPGAGNTGNSKTSFSEPVFEALRQRHDVFEDLIAYLPQLSRTGNMRSDTAFITLKTAVFAPIPSANVNTATSVKPGLLRN